MAHSRVYKNLTRDAWSIKQRVNGKWVVVGHCASATLYGVRPKISDKRHDAVRASGAREVFAWLEGDLCSVEGFEPFNGREVIFESFNGREVIFDGSDGDWSLCDQRITFHPFEAAKRGFYWVGGDAFVGCEACVFTSSSEVYGI